MESRRQLLLWMPLSDDDLKFLQKIYARSALGSKQFSRDELSLLSGLEKRVEELMIKLNDKCGAKQESYFIRLSTRSPKDGGLPSLNM